MLIIFIDGSSRGNPGDMGIGIAIYKNNSLIKTVSKFLGKGTNNEAEYLALLEALKLASTLKEKEIEIRTDSLLLINQLNSFYKVRAKNIKPLYENAINELKNFKYVLKWIPRKENKLANSLAQKASQKKWFNENF